MWVDVREKEFLVSSPIMINPGGQNENKFGLSMKQWRLGWGRTPDPACEERRKNCGGGRVLDPRSSFSRGRWLLGWSSLLHATC